MSDADGVGSYGRSAAGLTVALGIGGVLTYVFFILASRTLGEDQYGEIVVLWSVVFILASTLYRPIEQLLARTLAERDHAGAPTGDALRTAGVIQLGVCLATLARAARLPRAPLQDELFSENPDLYWAMLVSLAGFACAYFARGFLAGKGRFSIYAALLIGETLLRLAFAVVVAIGVLDGAGPDRGRHRAGAVLRAAADPAHDAPLAGRARDRARSPEAPT